MKKAILVLLVLLALLPFVSADLLAPSLEVVVPSILLMVFLANMAVNTLVVLIFQKFLGSFFEKLSAKSIIIALVGVTVLGFIGDAIGFYVNSSLTVGLPSLSISVAAVLITSF